jgi:hypothetical protein
MYETVVMKFIWYTINIYLLKKNKVWDGLQMYTFAKDNF